ncbi:MAG: hypothetical protein E7503_00455 [Ruminococcus sp.]|nr:hypothetical protein [Ruminococcus sp.]
MEERFSAALDAAAGDLGCKGIGTLRERTLHLALKYYFAPDPLTHEQSVGGFVADAVTEDGVIEVQTRSFIRLKEKLRAFLEVCPVTVVHPIAAPRWVVWVDENGVVQSRRRSPKKESVYTVLSEIYSLRELIGHPGLRFALCSVEVEQYRCMNGYGKQKKIRGEHIDRVPIALHGIQMLETPVDYLGLLPCTLPDTFVAAEAAAGCSCGETEARMLLNLLERLGMTEKIGKRQKCNLWRLTSAACDIMGR